jgi:hypothetical protein
MDKISRIVPAAALLAFAGWVNAVPMTFTDVVDPEPNVSMSANDTSFTFLHDITDDGFNPATDSILSATLLIDLGDNAGPADGTERAEIYLDGTLVASAHNPVNDFSYAFSFPFTSLIDGLIDGLVITIARPGDGTLGDFYFNSSALTVNVERAGSAASQIPEPSTLALVGLGLLSLGRLGRGRRDR